MSSSPLDGLIGLALREAWLVVKSLHGICVTYSDGTNTFDITGVKTRSNAQAIAGDDVILESNSWDFLFEPADLLVNGVPIDPSNGHTITEQDGTVHRLIPGNSSDLVFRYSDQNKTWLRCYAEQIT
jgi:hypothetical protein